MKPNMDFSKQGTLCGSIDYMPSKMTLLLGSRNSHNKNSEDEIGRSKALFCLEHPMDRGAWQASVHGVAGSWT